MKKAKLERTLIKSRLVKALYKSGYKHLTINGNNKQLSKCEVSFSANGQTVTVGLDLSGIEDYMQAANIVLINIEPEIKKILPDLDYGWLDDDLIKLSSMC